MKNLVFKRVLPVALALVLCFSFSVPVFALTFDPERADANDISQRIGTANGTWKQLQIYYIGGIASAPNFGVTKSVFDGYFVSDYPTDSYASYVFVSMDALTKLAKQADFPVSLTYLPSLNIYVLIFDGEFGTTDTDTEADMVVEHFGDLTGSALIYQSVPSTSPAVFPYRIVAAFAPGLDEDVPSDLNSPSAGTSEHNYYTDNSSSDTVVNVDGSQTVTNNYQSGDTYNTETFDYSNGTWYDNVTGTVNDIESLHYNPVTNTYTVNNTYNITYEYNYTYYYNLGSSENLVQDYKFYYELPDGRSSADLTADEISGLSLEFDVVNYAADFTDENTKVLVPFDGTWDNIAYNGADLRWMKSPSVTYRESASFGGSLYLPGSVSSGFYFSSAYDRTSFFQQGMTAQFRLYIDGLTSSSDVCSFAFFPYSYTSPYTDSGGSYGVLYCVDNKLRFDEWGSGRMNLSGGSSAGSLTPGVWNDISLSIVPVSSDRFRVLVFVNGLNTLAYTATFNSPTFPTSFTPAFRFNFTSWSGVGGVGGEVSGLPYQMIDNLRVVDFALYDSTAAFEPTPVPFDTNLVYVLPDTANLKDNTIAVQSGIPVSGYRIGGVRPTFPDVGMVWMPLDGNKIADCQIYRGNYWESVGCRVWTGERWVPAWAFDVVTLSDLWDMYGGEETDNYTEITPGSFYQWFQQHFLEFKTSVIERLDKILQALGVQTDDSDVTEPDAEGNSKFSLGDLAGSVLKSVVALPVSVVTGFVETVTALIGLFAEAVVDLFSGFADLFDKLQSFSLIAVEGEEGEEGVSFFNAAGGVAQLTTGTFEALPDEVRSLFTGGFMVVVIVGLLRLFL